MDKAVEVTTVDEFIRQNKLGYDNECHNMKINEAKCFSTELTCGKWWVVTMMKGFRFRTPSIIFIEFWSLFRWSKLGDSHFLTWYWLSHRHQVPLEPRKQIKTPQNTTYNFHACKSTWIKSYCIVTAAMVNPFLNYYIICQQTKQPVLWSICNSFM